MSQIINGKNGLVCAYCGATKDKVIFIIGAKSKDSDDFCMVEGTGKMACGKCYAVASKEGSDAIDRYVEKWNASCKPK